VALEIASFEVAAGLPDRWFDRYPVNGAGKTISLFNCLAPVSTG
jgi:hypothetical protein